MALNHNPNLKPERPRPDPEEHEEEEEGEEEEEEEEREVEKLEREVKQMAEKIVEYRATLPSLLHSTLASLVSSQRPVLALPLNCTGAEAESSTASMLTAKERNAADKARLLREKIASNVAAMPNVLKRMKECISRIDELDSFVGTIHPAFKRKKTTS